MNLYQLVQKNHLITNKNGTLIFACKLGNVELVNLLLNEIGIHMYNEYLLRIASQKGHTEIVKLLIEKGANIHIYNDMPLRSACLYNHVQTVKLILEQNADIHANDDEALITSIREGHTEIVKLLLEKGANVHANDDEASKISKQKKSYRNYQFVNRKRCY